MKTQFSKLLAVLMAVAMVLSMFCFTAFAQDTDAPGTDIVATMDEATPDAATADEATADESTVDETTVDEATPDETTTDEATEDEVLGLLGDTDLSGSVNVKDATLIQKAIAGLATLDEVQTILADTFADGNVNVKDATEIQKAIAGLPANALIGTPVNGAVEAPEATDDEIVATDDEVVATDDEIVATDDEVVATDDEASADETTADEEPVEETKFYIVGYINGVDYYDYDYEIVDGTITLELTSDSYVLVKDEFGVEYWTNGWLDFNPTSAVLGSYASNDKFHVAAGTVTLTWDAATFTLALA